VLCETKDILVELDNLHAYKGRKTGRKALLPTYDFEAGRTYEFSPKKGWWKTSMQKISAGGKYVFNHISNGKCRIYVFRHKSGRYTESFSCVQLTDFNVKAVGRQ
jgi:hypothetical protein